ncbi:GNAT family N-acetyltransferase [Niameybacter massiliensis]|uniref:GNAT family N-acetyltransferase n=1 Tax=Holtiella tumoricola TaxID=3018743 RepID=A0AA42DQN5_9FIRM|nr:GNAT family N-acetyltransferase [Holtiella tumoricola]MDA3733420.1 GNAT family N-acetyltransferase [Holtiella tumoricola]
MIYYNEDKLLIRSLKEKDAIELSKGFEEQGWDKPVSQFEKYFREQNNQERQVFIAELEGSIAGYVTLLPKAISGPFKNLPEVCDFNVLIKYQGRGIGNKLLDTLEHEVQKSSDIITLGVGMHYGYGPAQRMYVKRGYIPDGSGLWYKNKRLELHSACSNIDDLVLYLSKKLK